MLLTRTEEVITLSLNSVLVPGRNSRVQGPALLPSVLGHQLCPILGTIPRTIPRAGLGQASRLAGMHLAFSAFGSSF